MPPEVNLNNEKNNGEIILKLIRKNLVLSAHDVSSGGLLVALSEMSYWIKFWSKDIYKPKKLRNYLSIFLVKTKEDIIEIKNSILIK